MTLDTYCQGENCQEHLAGTEEADKEEDEKRGDKIVCLVVEEIAHHPTGPFLWVV